MTTLRTRKLASPNSGATAFLAAIFPAISFYSQNCNSLNISTCCEKQLKKLSSIVSCNKDIIFLSDIRLGTGACVQDLITTFRYNKFNQYDFFYNSSQNRRGVGILIKHNLNYSIEQVYNDKNENILCLTLTIDDFRFRCAAVYGPNLNDRSFFNDLTHILSANSDLPIVLGGDWNMTVSTLDNNFNIDTLNMQSPPSVFRSRLLYDLCSTWNLTDPFRVLHPDVRDYTYIPRSGANNRSRIDFFLVSNTIVNLINNCAIEDHLKTKLFDHKPVLLDFKPQPTSNNKSITNNTINHPRFGLLVAATAVETYLHHAARTDPEAEQFIFETLRQVGRLNFLLKSINDIEWDEKLSGTNNNGKQILITEAETIRENLPDPEILNALRLEPADDVFFEVLANNIMNSLKSFQGWLHKLSVAKKSQLSGRLNDLKQNYTNNFNIIFQLENDMAALVEDDLKNKISSLKIFENLQAEKPTPLFLNLTKQRVSSGLEKIKKSDGSAFSNNSDRENFIFNSFQELYRRREGDPLEVDVIENFLGPEIANSDIVQNSKLTAEEHNNLERPLTISELDISVKKGKLRSAPGIDGYSNLLIIRCWKFLRHALLRYANHCYTTGELTQNFRSARIRLIPKKGDQSTLKNWRPISLLSNLYKVISRAINSRLNKVVNRICSRAQKGYNSQRYTQEVLINTWEQVSYCKKNGIRGAVVAIDMAKAFDTLSHDFVNKTYEFFNIGPNMRRWLNLLGNNREACINFGINNDSRYFKLGRGRPQGDNISPNSFNFSIQILIFRLELDPLILPIPKPAPVVPAPVPEQFRHESNRETSKNESLADDNTTLTIIEENSLSRLRMSLIDFEAVSGLACNFDKTCVMPILEPTVEEVALLERLNFKIVDRLTLLGVEITRGLDNTEEIFSKIREKIVNLGAYWERFRLSLPGRITVAKTFLLSQLNYVASWLKPSPEMLNSIQSIIDNFVLSTLNISKERLYLPVNKGGIGMFNLATFFTAQHCTWLAKAHKLRIDNWRHELASLSPGNNICAIRCCDIDKSTNPILYDLVDSYVKFYGEFTRLGNNIENAMIFDNPAFTGTNGVRINSRLFGVEFFNRYRDAIRALKFNDCFTNDTFKDLGGFRDMGVPIKLAAWMQLRAILLLSRQRIKKDNLHGKKLATSNNIGIFLSSIVKGSKKFRRILEFNHISNFKASEQRTVITFCNLTNSIAPVGTNLEVCLESWNKGWLSSDLKSFIFRFRNNILPLSNRVNNYNNDIDPHCYYCRTADPDTNIRESFAHCFFDCPMVHDLIFYLNMEFFFRMEADTFKKFYWYGIDTGTNDFTTPAVRQGINLTFWDTVRFVIFRLKVRRILPTHEMVRKNLIFTLKTTLLSNQSINAYIRGNNFFARFVQALG
jgi:exonuclease III